MTSSGAASPTHGSRAGSDPGLSIADVAERTGMSKDTLRYYEKAGLIQAVERSTGGRRRYASADLDWLTFLLRLRATGMSIADMQRFAELRRVGSATVAERLTLLTAHRDDVGAHLTLLQAHLRALQGKIAHYQALLDAQDGTDGS